VGESVDAFFRVAKILVGEAEVVPGVGILREFFCGDSESGAGSFEFLLGEKRDAEIEARDFEGRVNGESLLEIFLRVGGTLLIQIRNAKSILPVGFGSVVVRLRVLRRGRSLCRARMKECGRDGENRKANYG
jgi:hypothetical protein